MTAQPHRLPAGVFELAATLAAPFRIEPQSAAELVMMPVVAGLAGGRRPTPIGSGAVHRDLGPDDEDLWEVLLDSLGNAANDSESVAAAAQEWRLAVTPYRRTPKRARVSVHLHVAGDPSVVDGVKVLDLTALWAGPLATRILADCGAEVTRIEPSCRLDNLRFGAPEMFTALAADKTVLDLDLRCDDDRSRFFDLVAETDLVIDSFSRRVMPNLAITPLELRSVNPRVLTISMPAFPLDVDEAHWISFGTGVHAISGLGDDRDGGFWAPCVAYPDPLAGFAAANAAVQMLEARRIDGLAAHREITLLGSIAPLR